MTNAREPPPRGIAGEQGRVGGGEEKEELTRDCFIGDAVSSSSGCSVFR